jgi:uncharacterized phage protein (TIGR01671 family)
MNNRVIKFRAWDKLSNGGLMISPDQLQSWNVWLFNDPQYAFMQFTGLKDKNGKEIYEGDLLALKHEDGTNRFVYEVRYEDAKFVCYHVNRDYGKWGNLHRAFDPDFQEYTFVVIGDVFSNPELIKSSEEVKK